MAGADLTKLIDRYCEAWCEDDAGKRADILQEVFAERATYTDPMAHVDGRANLAAHIGVMRQQFPGAVIARTSAIDAHNHCARFGWQLTQPNGPSLIDNVDFIEVRDGKIQSVVGFFGPLKPM
jgi:hypothetical protein